MKHASRQWVRDFTIMSLHFPIAQLQPWADKLTLFASHWWVLVACGPQPLRLNFIVDFSWSSDCTVKTGINAARSTRTAARPMQLLIRVKKSLNWGGTRNGMGKMGERGGWRWAGKVDYGWSDVFVRSVHCSEGSSCVSPSVVITGNVFMNVFVQFLSNSLLFGVLEF